MEGQINMRDAARRTLAFTSPEGKKYALKDKIATILARPRGWHMDEKHILFNGARISASIMFDWGIYFFHNAKAPARAAPARLFLPPAEAGEPRSRRASGTTSSMHAQMELGSPRRHDSRHGPHPDHHRRVRGRGDPLRAA